MRFAAPHIACVLGALWSAALGSAHAAYPERPITMIVPAAAGGNADITARLIGQEMSRLLGRAIVIENRVGAGGRIGTQALVRATPDGYTIGYAHVGTLVLHRFLFKQQLYNLDHDMVPIGLVTETPNVIVVNASSPYKTLPEFIAAAKREPDKLTMASADPGTTSEVGVRLFKVRTGTPVRHIPYKATAAAATDLLGGQVDALLENLPPMIANLQAGKLRALAVTTRQRAASQASIPTVAEQGYPEYEQAAWSALIAPRGTPPEIVRTLNTALNRALASPQVRTELKNRSQEALGGTPEDVKALIRQELPKWEAVNRTVAVTLD